MPQSALEYIRRQIQQASDELSGYSPREMSWLDRARAASDKLVPWLDGIAPSLKASVEDVLNAPMKLRELWTQICNETKLSRKIKAEFNRQLKLDDALRESVTGETISKVVTNFLIERNLDLRSNGRSDYPDLFLRSADYSGLAVFRRKSEVAQEFGAALKGSHRRPVRVPDGLEIKTCRDQIRVDCHHPHAGLHLVVVFAEQTRQFCVTDVCLAFLKSADYREAARNTTATTVKYSFNRDRFVSLLSTS